MSSSSLVPGLQRVHDAVRELLEGQIGAEPRLVPHGSFKYAELIGLELEEQQKIAKQTELGRNWFDIEIMGWTDNASSPHSALSNRRVIDLELRIEVIRFVLHRSTVIAGVRTGAKIAMFGDIEDASQALGMPGAMSRTYDNRETGILDGCCSQRVMPPGRRITPFWPLHLLRTEIPATMIVEVVQAV